MQDEGIPATMIATQEESVSATQDEDILVTLDAMAKATTQNEGVENTQPTVVEEMTRAARTASTTRRRTSDGVSCWTVCPAGTRCRAVQVL
ncbi:hypothetical protein DVH05_021427 [Phytophthora capsici]|nr:hypothetical protein DVH05_021427 [Phytophthora capsici]